MVQSTHPFRIFGISTAISCVTIVLVWIYLGPQAALLTVLLSVIELTFSFDNAIINARILKTLSPFWQQLFLTVGILIAVFGMRLVFPIAIVAVTAGLPWQSVIDLAVNQPGKYSEALESAKPLIASFGGGFLLMLALHFFLDRHRSIYWLPFEKVIARFGSWWLPLVVSTVFILLTTLLPGQPDPSGALIAGLAGVATFLLVHGLSEAVTRSKHMSGATHKTGLAAFWTFLYLEVLDASFSFDGVIGAFAITSDVFIIAAGLGIGAFWVRSLTVYMVRRKLLDHYVYLDHGAHYTIFILALTMFASLFFHLPEAVPGLVGLAVIASAVIASRKRKVAL